MKKIILATTVTIIASVSVSANAGIPRNKANKEVRKELRYEKQEARRVLWLHSVDVLTEDQFYSDFPDAEDVSWTEGRFAEATFLDQGVIKTAYYDNEQELIGTITKVDYSVIPGRAKKTIEKRYPGYAVEKTILFDDNDANSTDMFLYNTSFADEDSYFSLITKGAKRIILQVSVDGDVSFFRQL